MNTQISVIMNVNKIEKNIVVGIKKAFTIQVLI